MIHYLICIWYASFKQLFLKKIVLKIFSIFLSPAFKAVEHISQFKISVTRGSGAHTVFIHRTKVLCSCFKYSAAVNVVCYCPPWTLHNLPAKVEKVAPVSFFYLIQSLKLFLLSYSQRRGNLQPLRESWVWWCQMVRTSWSSVRWSPEEETSLTWSWLTPTWWNISTLALLISMVKRFKKIMR